ncbi:MAG TPA: RsmB/NOP family class I SAM-dependent RNA methyltransferase [Myxococcaceae bacterium]|nr:RsmB/NOP family class I SAM-dependent RNA methyltransferase [Myxococcaceae bacterium]
MTPRTSTGTRAPTLQTLERAARDRLAQIDWSQLPEVRRQVLEALGPVLHGGDAARLLTVLMRSHPGWDAAHRAVAAEALFGVALWRRRLAYQAGSEAPGALLTSLLRDVAHLPAHSIRAWTAAEVAEARPPPDDWPTRFSWPEALVPELEHALGPEAPLFAAACNLPGPVTVRANRLRLDRDALAERLAAEGVTPHTARYAPDALHLDGRPNVLGLPSHQEGLFEVQDEGSQLAGALLEARPGMRVLDLCAGAGGKTLLLAAALRGEGRVDAYDVDREALERLRHRAERAGAGTTVRVLAAVPEESYDAVLVDAPCSALGSIRRGPDVRWRTDVRSFAQWPPIQRGLLETAAARVGAGGRIVYVTCTVRPEENEEVVGSFLEAHPELEQVEAPVPPELRRGAALFTSPHRQGTDGFYGAVLATRGNRRTAPRPG